MSLPTFKQAFYEYVMADAEVVAAVSQLEILRVAEASRYPALTYKVTSRTQPVILDGPAGHDDVQCEVRIRGSEPATGANGASALVDAIALRVRALFNGKPFWDMAGLPVMASWVDDDTDDYDSADDASDEGTYIQTLNIFIRHRLAI